jgi:hypothetical protein
LTTPVVAIEAIAQTVLSLWMCMCMCLCYSVSVMCVCVVQNKSVWIVML